MERLLDAGPAEHDERENAQDNAKGNLEAGDARGYKAEYSAPARCERACCHEAKNRLRPDDCKAYRSNDRDDYSRNSIVVAVANHARRQRDSQSHVDERKEAKQCRKCRGDVPADR